MNTTTLRTLFLALALATGGCAATTSHESTGQYIDDASITAQVKTSFARSPEVDAMDIKVDTYGGVVQLSGFADSQAQIDRAVTLARNVEGVKKVENDIHLKTKG